MKLIIISMVIAIPVTYILIEKWLSRYAFQMDLSPWLFAIPAMAVLLIAVSTISGKTLRISGSNPANSLRVE